MNLMFQRSTKLEVTAAKSERISLCIISQSLVCECKMIKLYRHVKVLHRSKWNYHQRTNHRLSQKPQEICQSAFVLYSSDVDRKLKRISYVDSPLQMDIWSGKLVNDYHELVTIARINTRIISRTINLGFQWTVTLFASASPCRWKRVSVN